MLYLKLDKLDFRVKNFTIIVTQLSSINCSLDKEIYMQQKSNLVAI